MARSGVLNIPEKLSVLRLPVLAKPEEDEQERLLKLFWNRAELKKELQGLDEQLHNLRNRLKQQESANSRLQEQQEQLEAILARPSRAPDALVHFALRGLWRACRAQLEQLASDLRRQRQDKERKRQLAEFQADPPEWEDWDYDGTLFNLKVDLLQEAVLARLGDDYRFVEAAIRHFMSHLPAGSVESALAHELECSVYFLVKDTVAACLDLVPRLHKVFPWEDPVDIYGAMMGGEAVSAPGAAE